MYVMHLVKLACLTAVHEVLGAQGSWTMTSQLRVQDFTVFLRMVRLFSPHMHWSIYTLIDKHTPVFIWIGCSKNILLQ